MTMPHLMNCPHSDDSWCLTCVKEEWERNEKLIDLCQELDEEMDGVKIPRTAAAILNGIRSWLRTRGESDD